MDPQLLLPGFVYSSRPKHDFYLTLRPLPAAAWAAEQVQRRFRPATRGRTGAVAPHRFHVSLHFLASDFEAPIGLVRKVAEAAAMMSIAPFDVSFDRSLSFNENAGKHPFVLGGTERGLRDLRTFQQLLGFALIRSGVGQFVRPNARFNPHVTLFYSEEFLGEHPIEPIVWTVTEFVLVESFVGETHKTFGHWPLRP